MNFPENVELKVFLEYVSERLGLNLIYDEQTVSQRITIKSPVTIPQSSLYGLMESILQAKGLVLVDAQQSGWKRIVPAANLTSAAQPTTRPDELGISRGAAAAVTQVFTLSYGDVTRADQVIKPFLTQPGGNTVAVAEQHLLIVTDFAPNVQRIAQLIRILDQPQRQVSTQFVPVTNLEAQQLAQQIMALLSARLQVQGSSTGAVPPISVTPELRTNQLVLIGTADAVAAGVELARSLDVSLNLVTRSYHFQSAAADRVDRLVRELIGPLDVKRLYTSTIDKDGNLLIATTTETIHQRLATLKQEMDVPAAAVQQSPVRFYKLENTTATDVLQTIQAIGADEGLSAISVEGLGGAASVPMAPALSAIAPPPGANAPPPGPGQPWPTPPGYTGSDHAQPTTAPAQAAGAPRQALHGKDVTITADPNTNTIIVVAKPDVQRIYEQLIRALDKRRPQVLIECSIVTLDTTDSFNLGVEIAAKGSVGNTEFLTFSSFGLSKGLSGPDLSQLALNPGTGFNGVLLAADTAAAVIHALASTGRANVLSAPKILVNDNTSGQLSSVQEAPFTSVNASNTVATTSFAGYASAGTTITVTPHISEGDFLQLEYTVALNNFTGQGNSNSGTPPPRQTNQLQSKVTIPDGSTIVVGGLNVKNYSKTVDAVPILGQIPIVEYFFSTRTIKNSNSTLFVFLRPVVLRDDKFRDLKFYSESDVKAAQIPGDWPSSKPILIR